MHILIIPSSRFMTETEPHSAIFQWHQAKVLKNAENNVGILSVGYVTLKYLLSGYIYKRFENKNGISIYRKYDFLFFPHRYIPFFIARFMYVKKGIKSFEKYIQQHGKPDVIHAHNFFYGGFIAQAIKKKYGIKYVITEHSSDYDQGEISVKLDKNIINCSKDSNQVTAVSQKFANNLKKRFGIDIKVLPNIIDEYFFTEESFPQKSENFVFLNIASMESNKNQELLIKAFSKKFRNTNCELRLGGNGPLKSRLIEILKEMKMQSQVKIIGNLTREEVKNEMINADCFVLPSNYETFGVVLIEALACKTPIVATRCGGPQDIVNKNNGLLVDIGNLEQMADAMEYIYNNIKKFNTELIYEDAKKRFGSETFIKNIVKLYK